LKKEIEGIVTDWDHALFLNVNDIEWAEFMKQKEMKVVIVPGEPTAERMCSELFITLREKMRSLERPVHIKRVRIWENDDSMAEYES
jgi:6-pyruvoyl-tetrahydropterin synthase